MKVIELESDCAFLKELAYYIDHGDKYQWFIYQLYNFGYIKRGKEYSVSIPPEYNDTDFPDIIRIVSYDWVFGEFEGDKTHTIVIKVAENTFKEFIIKESSWDGPDFKGPFDVYPRNKVIYTKEKE